MCKATILQFCATFYAQYTYTIILNNTERRALSLRQLSFLLMPNKIRCQLTLSVMGLVAVEFFTSVHAAGNNHLI